MTRASIVRRPSRDRYLSTISPDHFCLSFKILFFTLSFVFVDTRTYRRKNISNDISSERTHQINSQKSCILQRRVPTKVYQRIVNFQILDFLRFYFAYLNMGPCGNKNFKRHLLWRNTPDLLPKIHVHFLGVSLPKLLKELWNLKFWIWGIFCLVFLWPFNMVINRQL